MNAKNLRHAYRKALVALVSLGLVLGPLGDALAQTKLGDIPIASKVQAKPNIIYTLDDSGSMQFSYLPDWVITAGVAAVNIASITRVGTTATATVSAAAWATLTNGQYITIFGATQPEYNGTFQITLNPPASPKFTFQVVGAPATPATGAPQYTLGVGYCRSGSNTTACTANNTTYSGTFQSPPFYAAEFNTLAYNPDVTYQPPVKADSTPLTHLASDTNMATGDQIYSNTQTFPYPGDASLTTHANLTGKVAVPLYCNTDWPLTVGGPNSSLAIGDVGDPNGEYKAGTGAWCRINGTAYDLSAASGAPAVLEDYNYPYQSSTGATGTQYFYRSLGTKVLYCDKTSPYYPRNTNVILGCLVGVPVMGPAGPPLTQTCNVNPKTCNPTVALRNWNKPVLPDVCTNSALYCLPNQGTPVASDGNSIGTGLPPECLPCQCKSDYQPLPLNKCSRTGAACPTACGTASCDPVNCPDQPGTPGVITGCGPGGVPNYQLATAVCSGGNGTTTSNFLWNPVTNTVSATTVQQDALAQGYACRHNNQTYAVSGAPNGTPFTYPRAAATAADVYAANKTGIAPYTQTGAFTSANAVTSGCPTIGATIAIPRHYYQIASVKFCDTIDTTANSQWKGFGIGACQATNDLGSHQIVKYGQFHRVNLIAGRTFSYTDQITGLPASRTDVQEFQNYANWFAYYRLRAHAAKATSSLAFSLLDDTYRVGFETLGAEGKPTGGSNPPAITWVDVGDFKGTTAGTTRFDFWTALFGVPTVTVFKTPILSASIRIGSLFENGTSGGLPSDINPLPVGAKDPLNQKDTNNNVITCQSNFHILFTDGFDNQVYLPAIVGEKDDTMPASWPAPGLLPGGAVNPDNVLPDMPAGGNWPRPFRWGTKAVPNTLADISAAYWARDLRPGLKDNVPSDSGKAPHDIEPLKDPAWWQHVQFSAISFGASGTLDASGSGAQKATEAALALGTQQWPDLTAPNNPPLPAGNKGAVAVDDLWHAAINARGIFVYAKSPLEVQLGLGRILGRIANNRKSATGAGFSGQILSATNDIIYEPTVEPGWSGDLLKVKIDPTTGVELGQLWSASLQLYDPGNPSALPVPIPPSGQLAPAFVGDEPWLNETKRRIVSWDPAAGKAVAFRAIPGGSLASILSNTQLKTLSTDPIIQYRMVSYLRGGSTVNPPYAPSVGYSIEGSDVGQYRERSGKLGDISHAQPLVVSPPEINPVIFNNPVADPGYSAFAALNNGRADQIVAAANDGMVHVIDSSDGHEVFAFVPGALFRSPPAPPLTPPCTQAGVDEACKPNGLQALTYQDGPPSIYKHHFYVDSSPRTSDVDFNSAGVKGGASDWHTIVVGGLGKGGNSYYALDLTDPATPDEKTAGAKVLWEVTDGDWKYTYGRPIIVKTYAYGWVVIVTSGYNNVSGEGRIYFLDPKTGAQVGRKFMRTPKITCTGPDGVLQETTGMAQINGFTKDFHNQFVEQIYGGDLCGNLWRFDLSDPNDAAWTVDNFAHLTDPKTGAGQPVTTAPQIEVDYKNGSDRYVFIGTGQLLDGTDLTMPATPQPQTMWAIRDGTVSKIRTPAGPPALPLDARTITKPVNTVTGAGIAGGAPDGWHHDLPDGSGAPAERIVIDSEADVSAVIYIGTQVATDPCTIALPVNVYGREFASGKTLITDGSGNPWVHDDSGGVGLQIVGMPQYDALGNVTGYTLGAILSHEIPGAVPVPFANPSALGKNRFSWRLLGGE